MKKMLLFFIFWSLVTQLYAQEKEPLINGVVTHQNKPMASVNVLLKGTAKGVRTDHNGTYGIYANTNDTLVFSYVGMQLLEMVVKKDETQIDISLVQKIEALDEVKVKNRKPFTQKELLIAYPDNMQLIKTSMGILDKDRASFPMRIIDGKNLIHIGSDFLYSLQNLYPQMVIIRDPGHPPTHINPKVYLGSGISEIAIFDVDGFVFEQPPTFIPANDIERVAILVRSGAIARYGPQAVGGVIIINTKGKNAMDDRGIIRIHDNSDLRDSLVEVVHKKDLFVEIQPAYMHKLNSAASEEQAERIYKKLELKRGDSPEYYLEVSDYFREQWKNTTKAVEPLKVLENKFPNNVPALKATAYTYDGMEDSENALATYLKILRLKSRDAQSHRDVANAYSEIKNYKAALRAYAKYERAINELDTIAYDSFGTDILMTTESANIIKLKGKELSLDKNIVDGALNNPSTRLLFEWNQKSTAFELQLVTPGGNYDTWQNTEKSNDSLLLNQKVKGYTSKQFFLDDDLKGEWQVGINYLGAISNEPSYLKVTVYFDYGTPEQKKDLKIFKLTEENTTSPLLFLNTDTKSISK